MLQSGSWYLRLCASLALSFFFAATASANSITLAWDPSTSEDVTGYTVRYGTSPGLYPQQINAGNVTSLTLPSLPNGTYYFVVQAYASDGFTSGYSNQLVVTVGSTVPVIPSSPIPQPTGCSTPDPFATLGGGTCYSGAWLPPGMSPPTSTAPSAPAPATPVPAPSVGGCTTPDPFVTIGGGVCINGGWVPAGMSAPKPTSPAPAPPPPVPVPSTAPAPNTGACTTPDPFVTIGGGVCVNGGWVPAGMVSSSPAPKPSTPSAPAPTPPPPSPSGGACTIPDPFATIGGGTCYNGGWLPPGMPVPGGASSTPSTTPVPQTPAPPALTTCTTPDPFVSLGGGTCYNGGWLPPGMEPPDAADDEVTITGTLHVIDAENGTWMIEAEDGTLYTSDAEIPEEIFVPGAIVRLHGTRLPAETEDQEVVVVEIISIEIQK